MSKFLFDNFSGIRPSWNTTNMLIRGRLTDRKIALYEKRGWYDPAFQQARKDLMAKKSAKRSKRSGNFDLIDGRMIYRPK